MTTSIRILHVDDDSQFIEVTDKFLQKEDENFETVTETHAEDAIEYLSEHGDETDCIVSDYALPDLNGIQFLENVREDHPDVPFIFFTGMGSETVARDALTSGATDYLQKQGGTEQYSLLANRIQDAVQQYRTEIERQWSQQSRRELYDITSATELSFDEKINQILELGRKRLDVENGHVVRIEPERDRHEISYAGGSDLVKQGVVTNLEETYCRHTISVEGLLVVHDASAKGFDDDPAYAKWGIGCYIGGRLEVGDDLYGTVCFVDEPPRESQFSEAERSFVDLVTRGLSHIIERQEHERELREEKERFELLVREVSTHAIFMLDPEGHVISWNEGAKEIKGYETDEILGRHFSVFYTEEQVSEGLPEMMLASAEKDGRVQHEGPRVRKDGSEFRAQVSLTALTDREGNLRGFGKVTQDLTDG